VAERIERVRRGSRRKRDLDAFAAIENAGAGREQRDVLSRVMPTRASQAAWRAARRDLAASLPPSTFELWISPVSLLGQLDGQLVLVAPDRVRAWLERRYIRSLNEAVVRVSSSFTEVLLLAPPTEGRP
jgi:hypothetical protein